MDIIRAWKDEGYRQSLTPEERAQLPENPAGLIELTDIDLADVAGGCHSDLVSIMYCPTAGNCATYHSSGGNCAS